MSVLTDFTVFRKKHKKLRKTIHASKVCGYKDAGFSGSLYHWAHFVYQISLEQVKINMYTLFQILVFMGVKAGALWGASALTIS